MRTFGACWGADEETDENIVRRRKVDARRWLAMGDQVRGSEGMRDRQDRVRHDAQGLLAVSALAQSAFRAGGSLAVRRVLFARERFAYLFGDEINPCSSKDDVRQHPASPYNKTLQTTTDCVSLQHITRSQQVRVQARKEMRQVDRAGEGI